jgi:hypothetical protein
MLQELITYTFDAEEWTTDGQLIDFTELAYPDCLSEIAYGDLILIDEKEQAKILTISDAELGFLALNLDFHTKNIQQGKTTKAFIASPHQHFEIELLLEAENVCTVRHTAEPEKSITMHISTLIAQAKNFRDNLWVDMLNHFPTIDSVDDFEVMESDFVC